MLNSYNSPARVKKAAPPNDGTALHLFFVIIHSHHRHPVTVSYEFQALPTDPNSSIFSATTFFMASIS